MKLKKLFLMLLILFCCSSVVSFPALASSDGEKSKISFKRPRQVESDFPSINVNMYGLEFRVFLNGFDYRSGDEIFQGVESYMRSWGEVKIRRLRSSGVTEIFLDEYSGALHGLTLSSPGYYPEAFHGRIVGNRLVLVVPDELVFWYVR